MKVKTLSKVIRESANPIGIRKIYEEDEPAAIGYEASDVEKLKAACKVPGLWNTGSTMWVVFVLQGADGWYKSKTSEAYDFTTLCDMIRGSDAKFIGREIVGIFDSEKAMNKVYDAITNVPEGT